MECVWGFTNVCAELRSWVELFFVILIPIPNQWWMMNYCVDLFHQNQWWWWWWWFFLIWLTDKRCLALFHAGTIVRDPHHRESATHREQDLNLCRNRSSDFAEWSCAVVITIISRRQCASVPKLLLNFLWGFHFSFSPLLWCFIYFE